MGVRQATHHATEAARAAATIALPAGLVAQLDGFRSLVRRVRLAEAAGIALCGLGAGYLLVFSSDRLGDPPRLVRIAGFALAAATAAALPMTLVRWVWRWHRPAEVARLIARRFPGLGDELLGAIDIVEAAGEGRETRSHQLCAAAVAQVALQARRHDFRLAVPRPRDRLWLWLAAAVAAAVALTAAISPPAAVNALARLAAPVLAIERFTFTRLVPRPDVLVVPLGEPAELVVELAADSRRRPARARARITGQEPLAADQAAGRYTFALPPQLAEVPLGLAVGDARRRLSVQPLGRPEIVSVEAQVTLPDYLAAAEPIRLDVRGGTVSPVRGSSITLIATATRALAAATAGGVAIEPVGPRIQTPPLPVTDASRLAIEWRDGHGLSGPRPLELVIAPRDDEAPTVTATGLPADGEVVLDDDTLRFTVAARDDYGVRRVGLEWRPERSAGEGAGGERLLEAGGSGRTAIEAAATLCPQACGIAPGPVLVSAYAEDFLPGRERIRTPPRRLYVVDRAEHALVMNDRLTRWRAEASEARDREMSLLEANRELRALPSERLLEAGVQERLERQAAAEDAQARVLQRLVDQGAGIVREALKNPEFEPATLERLAEDIAALSDIATGRMPGVAKLLRQAGRPQRSSQPAGGAAPERPNLPSVAAVESSQQPADQGRSEPPGDSPPRLGLPTTIAGTRPAAGAVAPPDESAAGSLDRAIVAQEQLLAEFARVADDLARVMASLEGSTFVKRLKLASREQAAIGSRIAGSLAGTAAGDARRPAHAAEASHALALDNARQTDRVSHLLDDLQAYLDRRQTPSFRTVLEEMRQLDALGSLRQQSDDIQKEAGLSIAQAEFWSDTFDRLADDLVPQEDPEQGRRGRGGERPSVPPEVILEAMRILEAETILREETRVAEQTKPAASAAAFNAGAAALAGRQDDLAGRIGRLADRLRGEPDGGRGFSREIRLFKEVGGVMEEAAGILRTPETGSAAIAAETEAIEMLLAAQAGGGGGGGGGGAATVGGDGSTGTTTASALALFGAANRTRRGAGPVERGQATGGTGRILPEEFRAGLDMYFNRIEAVPGEDTP